MTIGMISELLYNQIEHRKRSPYYKKNDTIINEILIDILSLF